MPRYSRQQSRSIQEDAPTCAASSPIYKGSLRFAASTSSIRRITLTRLRWTLRTSWDWSPARQKTIASTKACSIARDTSGFARMSGAVFARWLAASWSLRNRNRAGGAGAKLQAKGGGTNSRPAIVSPAAARSSGVKDTVHHLHGADDRRYHSHSNGILAI